MDRREAMRHAWALAWRGWGRVGANPLVGALVLRRGVVLGEGWHAEFGGPHAEVTALRAAGPRAKGAELIVTLEPCAHQGKTPPCADAIVLAGIRRVIYGAADVDPRARGGAAVLSGAGVAVEGGLCADEVRAQNAAFFHRHSGAERPYVAVKLALSLDGRIADHRRRSRWVTGEAARDWVHWLRAGFDAIGVAVGTVRSDDPQLTARGVVRPPLPPLRVVFDARAELPVASALVRTARRVPVAALVAPGAPPDRVERLRAAGVEVLGADGLAGQLRALAERGVGSLLVEGGGVLAGRLVAEGLCDRLYLVTAPVVLGRDGVGAFDGLVGADLGDATRWRTVGRRVLGPDTLTVLDR